MVLERIVDNQREESWESGNTKIRFRGVREKVVYIRNGARTLYSLTGRGG